MKRVWPHFIAPLLLLFFAIHAMACAGAMSGGSRRAGALALLGVIGIGLLIPAAPLIPLEIKILKESAYLSGQATNSYISSLPLKFMAMLLIPAYMKIFRIEVLKAGGYIFYEVCYSATHFIFVSILLYTVYKVKGLPLFRTALLVSTIIPWLYSGAILLAFHVFSGPK